MGSLRRRLTATAGLALLSGAAWAEVCDKERPGWDGVPVTIWSEPIYFFTSWFGLFILIAAAAAIVLRTPFVVSFVMLLSAAASVMLVVTGSTDPTALADQARAEGCVGPPHLSIALLTAISAAMFYLAFFGRPKQET